MTRSYTNYTGIFVLGMLLTLAVVAGIMFVSPATAQDMILQSSTPTTIENQNLGSYDSPVLQTSNEAEIEITVTDSTNGQDSATVAVTVENTVPPELEGSVTAAQYSAVLNGDDELSASNISNAVNQWANSGSVNDVDISASVLSALVNYWANN